jgi:hypothetical protein
VVLLQDAGSQGYLECQSSFVVSRYSLPKLEYRRRYVGSVCSKEWRRTVVPVLLVNAQVAGLACCYQACEQSSLMKKAAADC